ncbi:flagellar hook-length control protein FliK [Paenibacillus daejeonensis]|uniref:flagellar hook-length control protein FliK n=1 Tax=Paenibacillus daejeonensis TaxID=135193 RepID=UPI0003617897|nr:flagellar hook-length control protein FliK [Paenibacillus daejeonensis]
MNMGVIPSTPAMPVDAAGAAGTSVGQSTANAEGFAQVLVYTLGSAVPAHQPSDTGMLTQTAVASQLGVGQWQMPALEGEAGDLEQLIKQLSTITEDQAAGLGPEEKQQYEAVIEQLNAILIAMGMMAQAQPQTQASAEGSGEANQESLRQTSDMILGDRLQAVLSAVANRLDQGDDQSARQWFRTAVEPQLATLKQLLVKNEGPELLQTGTPNVATREQVQQQLQPTTVIHAGSHLQRLSQLASPQAAWTSSQGELNVDPELPELTVKADPTQAVPVGTIQDHAKWQPQVRPLVAQPVPVQQFPDTISGMILKQFDVTTVNGMSEARISLFPEHLGQVDIKITIVGGQLTAMFTAEHGMARELLENGMNQLRQALQQQGLQVDRLQVTQNEQAQQMFQEQRHQGSGEQQSSQQHKSPQAGAAEDSFEDELIQEAVEQDLGYGNAINVTA